jgi:hypothetical protein
MWRGDSGDRSNYDGFCNELSFQESLINDDFKDLNCIVFQTLHNKSKSNTNALVELFGFKPHADFSWSGMQFFDCLVITFRIFCIHTTCIHNTTQSVDIRLLVFNLFLPALYLSLLFFLTAF